MSKLIKTLPGQTGFQSSQGMILNADKQWRDVLIDDKSGTKIINADGSLRHEDHRKIMQQITETRRRSLNGVSDLISAGLTSSESIETMLVGTENVNEFQAAKRSMNPTALQNNNTNFLLTYTPLPITHQSWSIPWRQKGFAYKRSIALSESVRSVAESNESMLFQGAADVLVSVDGVTSAPVYGYTNHPNRVTVGISDWSDVATTGITIVAEVIAMVKQAFVTNASSRPDSLSLYVGNDVWTRLSEDYSAAKGDNTIKDRIMAIAEIKDVKPAEFMPALDTMLVEMSDRTIQLAIASDIVTIPHQLKSSIDDQVFTTYSAMVPIIRTDRNNRCGLVHGVEAL